MLIFLPVGTKVLSNFTGFAISKDELDDAIFAGFHDTISDLKVDPDGYLYFVSIWEGKIYRIVPQHINDDGRHLN